MRWLAFGTYDVRAHPRVAVLLEGLAAQGEQVDEVVRPLDLDTAARVRLVQQPWRLPVTGLRLLGCWARLVAATAPRLLGRQAAYDAVLVGYLGHFDVLLLRLLLALGRLRHPTRRRPVVVLDHLVSASGTAGDRGLARAGGVKDRLLRAVDAAALRAADVVVVDTAQRLTELSPDVRARSVVVPVGATREWFTAGAAHQAAAERTATQPMRALFVGLFTPLQGTSTIAEALATIPPHAMHVTLAGTGQDRPAARRLTGPRSDVTWVDWVPSAELPGLVGSFDVGLGIFGTTPKALAVVPTKVYQAAAAGCAVVTSDTVPQRLSLGDAAVFVPPGDPAALAQALVALSEDPAQTRRLGVAAHARAVEAFTSTAVVVPLLDHLRSRTSGPTREVDA